MIWTRVRTWIGTHPAAAVVIGNTVCLVPSAAAMLVFGTQKPAIYSTFSDVLWAALMLVVYGGSLLVVIAWSCLVGCLLGRSGLPVRKLWNCVHWTWLLCAGGVLVVTVASPGAFDIAARHWWEILIMGFLFAGLFGFGMALALCICMVIGLALAAWITRWQIRRGRWEVTRPVGPLENRP